MLRRRVAQGALRQILSTSVVQTQGVPVLQRQTAPEEGSTGGGGAGGGSAPTPTGTTTFALTFDDGPHTDALGGGANFTENVLNTLASKGLQGKAAFFIQTGVSYRGANRIGRALVARMHRDGYAIGIHTGGTIDHEDHRITERAGRLGSELTQAEQYIETITGSEPTLVRAPYGNVDAAVLRTYATLGLTHLRWDIDGDPDGPSMTLPQLTRRFDRGLANLRADGHGGYIPRTASSKIVVLYHDPRLGTSSNVGGVIDHIRTVVPTATFDKP